MSGTELPLHKGQPKHGGPQGCNLPYLSNPQSSGYARVLEGAALRDRDIYIFLEVVEPPQIFPTVVGQRLLIAPNMYVK